MRFLIGILTGTLLTLFIATAMDAPTRETLNKVTDVLSDGWQMLIDRTSGSLFNATGTATGEEAEMPELIARVNTRSTTAATDYSGEPGALRAAEPATPLPPPAELPPPPPVKAPPVKEPPVIPEVSAAIDGTDKASGADAPGTGVPEAYIPESDATESALEAWPMLAGDDSVEDMPGAVPADTNGDATGVWTPFHSQRSAEGFAARLSRTLGHEFRVERQGAGAYQVVFDVTSPAERDAVLMEIAEMTGE